MKRIKNILKTYTWQDIIDHLNLQITWRDLIPLLPQRYEINQPDINRIVKCIEKADNVHFYTGAGMSAASGIPTFRGKFGLWVFGRDIILTLLLCFVIFTGYYIYQRNIINIIGSVFVFIILAILGAVIPFYVASSLATPYGWNKAPKLAWIIFKIFFFDKVVNAKLNDGHLFMKYLKEDLNVGVYVKTSNVDGLECRVSDGCIRVHGRIEEFFCNSCKTRMANFPLDKLPWLNPKCKECGKRAMRTGCLLFNDGCMPPSRESNYINPNSKPTDLFFVIGTSSGMGLGLYFIEGSNIIEINLTDKPTTSLNQNNTTNHIYFNAPQEKVLKRLHDTMLKHEIQPKSKIRDPYWSQK